MTPPPREKQTYCMEKRLDRDANSRMERVTKPG
jgi:hypothetical protein